MVLEISHGVLLVTQSRISITAYHLNERHTAVSVHRWAAELVADSAAELVVSAADSAVELVVVWAVDSVVVWAAE